MAWTPTTTVADWGQIRVTVDNKDRTFFRDIETVVESWQDTDPYGCNNARLSFPSITQFDWLGDPELDWLREGAKVRIDHHDNGSFVKNLFIGFIDRLEIDSDGGVSANCIGDLLGWLTLKLHQPPIGRRVTRDAAEMILRELEAFDGVSPWDFNIKFQAGIDIAARGDRGMTRLGFVDYCLSYAIKANGDSLTILPKPNQGARVYRLGWRDLTTQHATVYAGAHGVKVRLSRDLVDNPNRIYGEGVSTSGERYRNAKYPQLANDTAPTYPMAGGASFGVGTTNADTTTGDGITVLARTLALNGVLEPGDKFTTVYTDEMADAVVEIQERAGLPETGTMDPTTWDRVFNVGDGPKSFAGSMFWPFAFDKATMRFLRSADGTIVGLNPDHDPDVIHVESFETFGEGVKKRRARKYARAKLNRNAGWAGTITLTSDPAEMSRFDLRAGMNIKVEHLKGALNQLLHIASVQVDWKTGTVTLAVSTQGRHFLDLATRKVRDQEARRDPGMHFKHLLRRSTNTQDTLSGWEGESGAGVVPATALTGGQWNVIKVVASEVGVISRLRLAVTDPTLFYAALFADHIDPGALNNTLGNPSAWVDEENYEDVWAANSDWLVEDERLMIEAWGTPDQPCGLGTKPYLNKSGERSKWPITGEHRDNASWDFWTENNFLYLAVYPMADCTIEGRMQIQITEGA